MYRLKKTQTRRAALRFARPKERVSTSIPGRGGKGYFAASGLSAEGCFGRTKPERVADRYKLQSDLIATLRQTEHWTHLVPRVAQCHSSFRHKVCSNRHEWAKAMDSCNVRLCPHDQRKRSLKLAARWEKVLPQRADLRYVVFAERNSADLSAGIASLYRAWMRLRKSALWKACCKGCVVVLEVTYNREQSTWHPHLNVLFEGSYVPFEALRAAWIEATRQNGQTSFIRAADQGTIRELLKYVTKLSDFVDHPHAVDVFLTAVARRRFIRTYGTFYRLPVDEDENGEYCPDCGSDSVADVGIAYADQITIDQAGVLRIDQHRLRRSQRASTEDCELIWPRAPVDRTASDPAWEKLVARVEQREREQSSAANNSPKEKN